ncbi:MAG: zinc ribbon domain-containing protein [Thermomicrobiales bacterium]|nr:zinc ribbon domain-containing protein [Thermomicrobiales bacterium]
MPTYHYRCTECNYSFDQFQKFSEDALTVCPECQGLIKRVVQPVGIVFKGSGWYITDSRKSGSGESKSTSSTNGSTSQSSKSESKPAASETKTAEPAKAAAASES